jgi:hypothetical protein
MKEKNEWPTKWNIYDKSDGKTWPNVGGLYLVWVNQTYGEKKGVQIARFGSNGSNAWTFEDSMPLTDKVISHWCDLPPIPKT